MKQILLIIFSTFLIACNNEKQVLLPQIQNAEITKVLDISPAYIFYDETKTDSVELNSKNLIITTNWLINVDKRLTLKQALPSIIKLQNKKRNAKMHKNEQAKNYFTCNDTAIKNLGFIDFTEIHYSYNKNVDLKDNHSYLRININTLKDISIITPNNKTTNTNINDLTKTINAILEGTDDNIIFFAFNKDLTFQDYISIKSELLKLNTTNFTISKDEFIFN
ncbi:hypothetical protein [Pontimicrobium sp. MEBiC01747]